MKKILLTILVGLLLIPSVVLADGAIIPPKDYYIYETGQKGAIFYDEGMETLVLSVSFEGDAKDFSWIVPTPSEPEVTKVSKDIFTNLAKLTEAENDNSTFNGISAPGYAGSYAEEVTVIEEKQVGYYDVTVLKSTDKDSLYKWLNDNGYKYPEDGKYVLDDYIRLGWTFTAIKITEDSLSDATLQGKLYTGDIAPLKFVFEAENMVFPLKISGIAQYYESEKASEDESSEVLPDYPGQQIEGSMGITLYIFADHKKDITDYSTVYANWVDAKDINKLALDEEGNPWVNADKKYFITKLRNGYVEYSDMDEDLYPKNANNNDTVGVSSWWVRIIDFLSNFVGLSILILMLMFFVPIYWQFKPVSRISHIVSWTLQIIGFLVLGGVPLAITLFVLFQTITYGDYIGFDLLMFGVPYIMGSLMMIVLLIAQGVWQRKYMQR